MYVCWVYLSIELFLRYSFIIVAMCVYKLSNMYFKKKKLFWVMVLIYEEEKIFYLLCMSIKYIINFVVNKLIFWFIGCYK